MGIRFDILMNGFDAIQSELVSNLGGVDNLKLRRHVAASLRFRLVLSLFLLLRGNYFSVSAFHLAGFSSRSLSECVGSSAKEKQIRFLSCMYAVGVLDFD